MKKKAYDITGLPTPKKRVLADSKSFSDNGTDRGVANQKIREPVPNYLRADCEEVYSGRNNTWIVLGRDRMGSRTTGYGGLGHTQAGAIDIVVGRLSAFTREVDDNGAALYVDSSERYDASRIYISQKSDVDDYFRIVDGRVGNSKSRASITMKSDSLRLIGREGIKLVTKTDPINSQGGEIASVFGIDLIAGNQDDDLQPLVKGDNLAEALDRIVEHVKNITSLFEKYIANQQKLNNALASHTHVGNLLIPTTNSIDLLPSSILNNINNIVDSFTKLPLHRTNLESFKFNYLKPFGSKYINSRHNNTN